VPSLGSGKKFSLTQDRFETNGVNLKESKTARYKPIIDDFDKISRMSAADRTLTFFQKRQQNRSLNKAFEEADYLRRKIISRSMLK
jgi:hypothetical protein